MVIVVMLSMVLIFDDDYHGDGYDDNDAFYHVYDCEADDGNAESDAAELLSGLGITEDLHYKLMIMKLKYLYLMIMKNY